MYKTNLTSFMNANCNEPYKLFRKTFENIYASQILINSIIIPLISGNQLFLQIQFLIFDKLEIESNGSNLRD